MGIDMAKSPLMSLGVGMVLCMTSSCRDSGQESTLHDRIITAHTFQYCRPPDACSNPHVLAVESGYEVTTFLGSKPKHAHVPAKDLSTYLQALPMQVWPRGPSIALSPTDVVRDQHAIEQNLYAAQQLCRSMGLEVQVLPGG